MLSTFKALAALGLVLTAALAAYAAVGRPAGAEPASAEVCAVYLAFYDQLPDRAGVYLRPTARPHREDDPVRAPLAPTRFFRDSDTLQPVTIDGRTMMRSSREPIDVDTSAFFQPVVSGAHVAIDACFATRADAPGLHDGPVRLMDARETLAALLAGGSADYATLWTLSPVGFSDDGRHALLYAEEHCTGYCGGGAYYLFERSEGWTLVGEQTIWMP